MRARCGSRVKHVRYTIVFYFKGTYLNIHRLLQSPVKRHCSKIKMLIPTPNTLAEPTWKRQTHEITRMGPWSFLKIAFIPFGVDVILFVIHSYHTSFAKMAHGGACLRPAIFQKVLLQVSEFCQRGPIPLKIEGPCSYSSMKSSTIACRSLENPSPFLASPGTEWNRITTRNM